MYCPSLFFLGSGTKIEDSDRPLSQPQTRISMQLDPAQALRQSSPEASFNRLSDPDLQALHELFSDVDIRAVDAEYERVPQMGLLLEEDFVSLAA